MINKNPLISVILTTYNRSHLLTDSIFSVINGRYKNFEIIIVDDCSSDDTQAIANTIINEYPVYNIKYLKQGVNKGVLAARNRGMDSASGDLIAMLDDDDELSSDALEYIVDVYNKLPIEDRGILWFDCLDKEANRRSGSMSAKNGLVKYEDYLCGKIKGDFWLVFSRHVLDEHRFDERLRAHESLFWLKLHRLYPARYFPHIVCLKSRLHGERLCDVHKRFEYLTCTVLAMSEFFAQFGADLGQISSTEYGRRLAYYGLHQLMSGDNRGGRESIIKSLRYSFSSKYVILYILSFFITKNLIKNLYVLIESKSKQHIY